MSIEIKLTTENITSMLNSLPEGMREAVEKAIKNEVSKSSFSFLKKFIENLEEDNAADTLMASVTSEVIRKFMVSLKSFFEKQGNSSMDGIIAAGFAINALTDTAKQIQDYMQTASVKH